MSRYVLRWSNQFKQALGNHNIPAFAIMLSYDKERVKDVGADRAAAEWVVRCGGSAKIDRYKDFFYDYNTLIRTLAELDPDKDSDNAYLISIDGSNSSISGYGCRHFGRLSIYPQQLYLEGLCKIKTVKFINCKSLQDFGLEIMGAHVGNVLENLHLQSCKRITEVGVGHLQNFRGLRTLVLKDLPRVYKPERAIEKLRTALPHCEITTDLH